MGARRRDAWYRRMAESVGQGQAAPEDAARLLACFGYTTNFLVNHR